MLNNQNQEKEINKEKPNVIYKVAQIFSTKRDINGYNYDMDGDLDMYNQNNLQLRAELQHNPILLKQIDKIIELYPLNSQNKLEQLGYIKIQTQLAKILRPQIQKQEMQFIVKNDWQHDSQGQLSINKNMIRKSLYELIDIWTTTIQIQQYLAFTRLLHKKLINRLKK